MRNIILTMTGLVVLGFTAPTGWSEDLQPNAIQLPAPQMDGGMPLMKALLNRHSEREFKPDPLPDQVLANLLWAAFGVNRPEKGYRTAPSARNWQEVDIYIARADGVYLYDAKANRLIRISQEDIRAQTGMQPFVKDAPINLIYVADFAKAGGAEEDKILFTSAETGSIVQNVYLFCASENLATVVRASIDRQALIESLQLRTDQKIILAQTVGYPKK